MPVADSRIPLYGGTRPGAFPWSGLIHLPQPEVEPLFWDDFSVGDAGDLRDRTPLVGVWEYEYPPGWDSWGPGGRVVGGRAVFDRAYGLSVSQALNSPGGLQMDVYLHSADAGSNWFEFGLSSRAPYGGAPPYTGVNCKYEDGYLSVEVSDLPPAVHLVEIWRAPIDFTEQVRIIVHNTGVEVYLGDGPAEGDPSLGEPVASYSFPGGVDWPEETRRAFRAYFRPMYYSSSQIFRLREVKVSEI